MFSDRKRVLSLALVATFLLAAGAATAADTQLRSWAPRALPAPIQTLGDSSTFVMSFMPVAPCRIIDTRGGAPFTGGAFASGGSRDYQFSASAAPCTGIPAGARGVSINVTVTNTAGPGFLAIYPRNAPPSPLVSTINYSGGQTIANSAAVPTDSSGFITILCGVSGTDVIVDVNGYYIGSGGANDLNPGRFAGFSGDYGAGLFFSENKNTTGTAIYTSAVRGYMLTTMDGPSAVIGEAHGATGANYGVTGTNSSPTFDAAGVYGLHGTALTTNYYPSGVRGETGLTSAYGVLGIAQTNAVAGAQISAAGTFLRAGRLGFGTYGVYSQGDFGGTGAKYFVEPHPEDPTRVIKYIALEGPESGTYFRGTARTVDGAATITVPDSFRMVTDAEGMTVQLTSTGKAFAQMTVESSSLDTIVVRASRDVTFHYLVQGVRKAFKDFNPIIEGTEFVPERPGETMPAYLTQEARRRLVANGTYNADGTVNMTTAERVGWTRTWREREEAALKATAAAREASKNDPQASSGRQAGSGSN